MISVAYFWVQKKYTPCFVHFLAVEFPFIQKYFEFITSFPPSAAYMRHWLGSLVKLMACRLFRAKPLPKQCWIIVTWPLRNTKQWNFSQNTNISIKKMHMKLSFPEWRPFSPGGNELRYSPQLITVTSKWARWRLKSPASRLFTQPFIQVRLKENNKALCHWPLCGEFSDQWIPRTNGQ